MRAGFRHLDLGGRRAAPALAWALVLLGGCGRPGAPAPAPEAPADAPPAAEARTPAEPRLFDGFEGDAVAAFWRPRDAGEGRYARGAVAISREYARSGAKSVRITVREGDIEQTGGDGKLTERAELDSGKRPVVGGEAWYGFSVLVPPDFPVVDNRLVVAQWKQSGVGGSPLVAQRYRAGRHEVTIRMPDSALGLWKRYELPKLEHGRWNDMVYHVKFSTGKDGLVEAWMNGKQVVAYEGVTAFGRGEKVIYNKVGLYRDRWKEPMTIHFDNYSLGDSFEAVDPARFDRKP